MPTLPCLYTWEVFVLAEALIEPTNRACDAEIREELLHQGFSGALPSAAS